MIIGGFQLFRTSQVLVPLAQDVIGRVGHNHHHEQGIGDMRTIVWIGFLAAAIAAPAITSDVFAQQLVGEGEIVGTKIIVRELKRDEGGTVTVRLQLVNETDEPKDIFEMILGTDWVHLIDAANKKKYLVITDRSGKCECTDGSQLRSVSKGSPVNIWAKFPAPPEDVRKLTVVVKSFDPVDSVPITAH